MNTDILQVIKDELLTTRAIIDIISTMVALLSLCGIQIFMNRRIHWHFFTQVGTNDEYDKFVDVKLRTLSLLVSGFAEGVFLGLVHISLWFLGITSALYILINLSPGFNNENAMRSMFNIVNIAIGIIVFITYTVVNKKGKDHSLNTLKLKYIAANIVLISSITFIWSTGNKDWHIISQFSGLVLIIYICIIVFQLWHGYTNYKHDIVYVNIITSHRTYPGIYIKAIRRYKDGLLFVYENEKKQVIQVDVHEPYTLEYVTSKNVSDDIKEVM